MPKKKKRKKPEEQSPKPMAVPRGLTSHGKQILVAMDATKSRGNFKDYVLFVGDQMIDAWGSYTVRRAPPEGGASMVALVHKRDLYKIIGEDKAKKFWNRKLGRRTNHGAPEGGLRRATPKPHEVRREERRVKRAEAERGRA